MRRALGLSLLAAFLAWPAYAAGKRDSSDCTQNKDAERRIAGCTRILQDANEPVHNRAVANEKIGLAYAAKGDFERAVSNFSEAIRLDRKFASAYYNRALAYQMRNDYDRAIADYNEAIRLNPKYAAAYQGRGITKQKKGDASGGDADIAKAREIQPGIGR
jgi:tetratricopeptide (TPR) repeat protein